MPFLSIQSCIRKCLCQLTDYQLKFLKELLNDKGIPYGRLEKADALDLTRIVVSWYGEVAAGSTIVVLIRSLEECERYAAELEKSIHEFGKMN